MSGITIPGVPSSQLKPGVFIALNARDAITAPPPNIQSLLLCGHCNPNWAGGEASGQVKQIFTSDDAANYWGPGSVLHLMAIAALATGSPCALYGVCDDQGPPASGSNPALSLWQLQFTANLDTGIVSVPGVSTLKIGGSSYCVNYDGTTAFDIVGAFVALINVDAECPFQASSDPGDDTGSTLLLTAKAPADAYDFIGVSESHDAPGAGYVGFSSGLTQTLSSVALDAPYILAQIAGQKFNKYAFATGPLDAQIIAEAMETMSGPLDQRPGVAIVPVAWNYAIDGAVPGEWDLQIGGFTNAEEVAQPNDPRVLMPICPGMRTAAFMMGAAVAAVLANRENPNQHFDGEPVPGLDVPDASDFLINAEVNALLAVGIFPLLPGPGGIMQISRAITTYNTDNNGNPDLSCIDVTTITSLDYLRLAVRTMQQTKYNQVNITDNLLKVIPCDIGDVMKDLENMDPPVLENVAAAIPLIQVSRDSVPGRVDCSIPAFVVQGLHVLAEVINLQINTGS